MSEILARLYREYFGRGDLPGGSSHWREYSERFEVELNEDGVPVRMKGFGFGDLEAKDRPRRWAKEALTLVRTVSNPFALANLGLLRTGKAVAHAMSLAYAQDAWRQAMTLAFLRARGAMPEPPALVMIIGDGYGLLSGLIHRVYPNVPVVTVDLGRTLCFQVSGLQRAFPNARHVLVHDGMVAGDWDFLYVPAERIDQIPDAPLSLAINVASMQEMTPETVASYFAFMRDRGVERFYCCNRERKVLVGGEVSAFHKYPWAPEDVHLVDEVCPWHRYFLDRHTLENGPRVLGFRTPFVNHYDGIHLHRLTLIRGS